MQGLRRSIVKLTEHQPHIHMLIQEEKDVCQSIEKFAKERLEASTYLAKWGEREHADLHDVTSHIHAMNEAFNTWLVAFTGFID
jgi:Eisosome component PIL1